MQHRQDMPSRSLRVMGWLRASAFASLVGLATGLSFWFFLPDTREGRELALALAAQAALGKHGADLAQTTSPPLSAAEQFCLQVAGVPLAQADCRIGRPLQAQGDNPPFQTPALLAPATAQARARLNQKGQGYIALRDTLSSVLQGSDRSWLLGGVELRLARLMVVSDASTASYGEIFDTLLLADGLRYDSSSGMFSVQRWDIARLLERPDQVRTRAERLAFLVQWLPLVTGLAGFAVAFVFMALLGWAAALLATTVWAIVSLGLLIVADASLRFGQGSPVYLLNPFSYALERQALVVAGVWILPVCGLLIARFWGHRLTPLLLGMRRWLTALVVITMLATTAFYSLMGPAAGSEALKLSVCLFAGLITTGYARQTFLARKFQPDLFSMRSLASSLGEVFTGGDAPTPRWVMHASLFRAYLGLLILGLGTMAAAALVFSDFGGTLVSGVVFTALIFILFGLRLALVFLFVGGGAGALALLTEKVQGRVQLMLDPMTASVSDFARLIKFSEAAQPSGYGLGTIRWCSFEGACLPIQALSDYFPVLLSGALGVTSAVFIFLVLMTLYIGLMARAVLGLASGLGPVSVVYSISFFLLLAALAQTVITYFGNWRLAPLTGLGLPLMSLGWSSMLSAALGLSLLAMAVRMTPLTALGGRA